MILQLQSAFELCISVSVEATHGLGTWLNAEIVCS